MTFHTRRGARCLGILITVLALVALERVASAAPSDLDPNTLREGAGAFGLFALVALGLVRRRGHARHSRALRLPRS